MLVPVISNVWADGEDFLGKEAASSCSAQIVLILSHPPENKTPGYPFENSLLKVFLGFLLDSCTCSLVRFQVCEGQMSWEYAYLTSCSVTLKFVLSLS